ncbi:hypothetical protein V4D30_00785 [Thermodesulfovibrio sp. 3907-1M]|jgi:malonyl CoA-acyl carrier protein transacylase|uniref:Uncharacterized protein n=1 Tax=Thermodesulfovibrio autotrophicus TaxID=3118333 RepID=A0AAU8GWB9_9BACT
MKIIKPRIPVEVVLFMRKAHKVVGNKKRQLSKEECRKFKNKKNSIIKNYTKEVQYDF